MSSAISILLRLNDTENCNLLLQGVIGIKYVRKGKEIVRLELNKKNTSMENQ